MIAICIFVLLSSYLALTLFSSAHWADVVLHGPFGEDLAEPTIRPTANVPRHQLARWLAFHDAVRRVA